MRIANRKSARTNPARRVANSALARMKQQPDSRIGGPTKRAPLDRFHNMPRNRRRIVDDLRMSPVIKSNHAEEARAAEIRASFEERFAELAGDFYEYHQTMMEVFGGNYNAELAEEYRQRALGGDFDWLPPIEFADYSELGDDSVYDAESGVVRIARDLPYPAQSENYAYWEGVGDFLGTLLTEGEPIGDHGENFRDRLGGYILLLAD